MDDIKQDLKDIKEQQQEHSIHLARYNVLLEEHIKRTEQLEERVQPIEDHVKLVAALGKLTLAIIAAAGALATVFRLFK